MEGESLQMEKVLGKYVPSFGKCQKWQQSPMSRPKMNKLKWGVTQSKTHTGRMGHDGRNLPLRKEQFLLKTGTEGKRNQTGGGPGQVSEGHSSTAHGM